MLTSSSRSIFRNMWAAPELALLILLSICAQSAAAVTPYSRQQNKGELIQELKTAKSVDWENALDPNVAPVTQEDFLDQMNKADRAIKELTHGFEVPQSEINDALWSPPKSISPGLRIQLIHQLEDAVRSDDHNEQAMLNDLAWSDSAAPADTATFDEQMALAQSVIKDLEIDQGVHWSTIKGALQVPQSPY